MSDISFSHQFSHQWRHALPDVKQAIAQELNDIVYLLKEDTNIETFEFTHPNLNTYLDNCYTQAIYNNAYVSQSNRLDTNSSNNVVNNTIVDMDTSIAPVSLPNTTSKTAIKTSQDSLDDSSNNPLDNSLENPTNIANTTDNDTTLSAEHHKIIEELEAHIENYLSEQMTALSNDLKLWLKEEIKNYTFSDEQP